MGSGAIHDGRAYVALVYAHMVINLLGWLSITIVATLVTLLPSILRSLSRTTLAQVARADPAGAGRIKRRNA